MTKRVVVFVAGLMVVGWSVSAQQPNSMSSTMAKMPAPMTAADQIKKAMASGPSSVSKDAAIMTMDDKMQMKQLRAGTNGWWCMAAPEAMCLDKQWQAWTDAYLKKTDPKITGIGIAYMMLGDNGASNTNPFAETPTATNHWVVSGPHMMVLTPDASQLNALPTDPMQGGPWVMWKGSKYAHIMVPTAPLPKQPIIK